MIGMDEQRCGKGLALWVCYLRGKLWRYFALNDRCSLSLSFSGHTVPSCIITGTGGDRRGQVGTGGDRWRQAVSGGEKR